MNIKRLFFFGFITILFSCSRQIKTDGITITGQIRNAAGMKLSFSELDVDGIISLDSTILDQEGHFLFHSKPVDAGFYLLKLSTGQNILLLMEKEESANVSADLKEVPFEYKVTGSKGSDVLLAFYSQTSVNLHKADSLASILRELKDTPGFYPKSVEFEPLFQKITEDQRSFERKFILKNSHSLASLIVLNYQFGLTRVLNEKSDFDLYVQLDTALSKTYASNKHLLLHHKKVIEHQRVEAMKQF